jgi:hypothetical protein
MVTIAWHEVISWAVALISTTLFIAERRKNDNVKYYMVLQGLLRACNQRCGFLVSTIQKVRDTGREIPRDEFCFVVESEYANYVALQEHIMGSMKSIQPDKDMPFDVGGFVRGNRRDSESLPANNRMEQARPTS